MLFLSHISSKNPLSGVDYKQMTPDQMVVTDLDGKPLEADGYRPSSDLPTHVVLYKAFPGVNAVVHTHSKYAVCWAQAGRDLPCYGTTHADTFYGPVPLTRHLTETEVAEAYEVNTGVVIADTFKERNLDPLAVPGVLVQGHGPFSFQNRQRFQDRRIPTSCKSSIHFGFPPDPLCRRYSCPNLRRRRA